MGGGDLRRGFATLERGGSLANPILRSDDLSVALLGPGSVPVRLTIAMPCYNEEACVEEVVREVLGVAETFPDGAEVVVVDDGSTDATPEILARVASETPRLRVIRHEHNLGIAGFNRRMMQEARGEWVLFTSSDGEFDPREAVRFVNVAEAEGADAVLGYRTEKNYSLYRLVVSWSFNRLTWLFFGIAFRDIGSMRMLRRARFQTIPVYSQSAFLNAERLLVGCRRGAKIVEVPIFHRKRIAGVGSGSRPRKVAEAIRDLLATRVRWLRLCGEEPGYGRDRRYSEIVGYNWIMPELTAAVVRASMFVARSMLRHGRVNAGIISRGLVDHPALAPTLFNLGWVSFWMR